MASPLTVRLNEELEAVLDRYCRTSGRCRSDVVRFVLAEHELIVGRIVLDELRRVLEKEIGLLERPVEEAAGLLEEHRVVPTLETDPGVDISDPSDARVLATALAAGAEELVTGDRDLLSVRDRVRDLRILDPRGFWEELHRPSGAPPS